MPSFGGFSFSLRSVSMDGGKPNVIDLGKYTVERIREIAVLHGECVKPGTKEERDSVFRMARIGMCVLGIISHFDVKKTSELLRCNRHRQFWNVINSATSCDKQRKCKVTLDCLEHFYEDKFKMNRNTTETIQGNDAIVSDKFERLRHRR